MHYVCSDIHGEIERYQTMLQFLNLKEDDILYVLGDVIDRQPHGVQILNSIMENPHIQMILGNHELLCLQTLGPHSVYGARDVWKGNGGSSTYRELVYHTDIHKRNQLIRFLSELPDHVEVTINSQEFYLVHGFPGKTTEDRVWNRPEPLSHNPFPNKQLIIGHTPVSHLLGKEAFQKILQSGGEEHLKIFRSPDFIDIDCGCGNSISVRRLACLCLETMQEFYF